VRVAGCASGARYDADRRYPCYREELTMPLVEIVIALALLQFIYFAMCVGAARGKYQVAAPAVAGHDMFERNFRIQMNTLELLVVFVPAILLFGKHVGGTWAAALGAIYIIGRFVYQRAYLADPQRRGLGYGLSLLPTLVLLLGGLGGAVYHYIRYLALV
jgi:uncharacterized MAPEG superfamily protein